MSYVSGGRSRGHAKKHRRKLCPERPHFPQGSMSRGISCSDPGSSDGLANSGKMLDNKDISYVNLDHCPGSQQPAGG